ncbi:DNA kinase/phosphatase Pnk1 [Friedmanniomyces endolithicus]|nr:DNA kinase/phosphatase Pnk1 [Friedmanniomyces endolithicus]KAK0995485.1 DNA kinase/phosphatase Pnk1 [Friedmanniomyces endolithicus]KAK1050916.1 DNA kinase/phosphatase Pnk1 [Friedmanniomyces endolithicus]
MTPASLKRVSSTDRDISPPPAKRRIAATTTSTVVSNFFKPASQKAPDKVVFQTLHSTLFTARHQSTQDVDRPKPLKIAAFDFDDTIVTTKGGTKFSRGADDWQWWNAAVPSRLKQLNDDGYAIIIVSNQAAVSLRTDAKSPKDGMRSVNNLRGKVMAVMNTLDLPITMYAATEHDLFRKPRTGMWEQMLKDYGLTDHGDIDHEKCFFVGDAAGREADKSAGLRKDHSCCDRDFAANVGIAFHTPEEYFLDAPVQPFVRTFDPAAYLNNAELTAQTSATPAVFNKKHDVDIVLFCGSPGAGKSTFYWTLMSSLGYERVNQDLLKSRDKCMKVATQHVVDGKPVVVDNTNADIETRASWVGLATKLKVPIRLVHFTATVKLCEHNDTVRALAGELMNPEKRTLLPKVAFTGFASRYQEPKIEEGFQDITTVDFGVSHLIRTMPPLQHTDDRLQFEGSEEQAALWKRFWVS